MESGAKDESGKRQTQLLSSFEGGERRKGFMPQHNKSSLPSFSRLFFPWAFANRDPGICGTSVTEKAAEGSLVKGTARSRFNK